VSALSSLKAYAVIFFILCLFLLKVPFRNVKAGWIPITIFLTFTFVSNVLHQHGKILFSSVFIVITEEGLKIAATRTLRIFYMIMGAKILMATSKTEAIIHGLWRLLSPFERLGLPVKDFFHVMGLTLKCFPVLKNKLHENYRTNITSNNIRGIWNRAGAVSMFLLPMFVRAYNLPGVFLERWIRLKKRIDILIKGGTIYDGTLREPYVKDIAICGDSIYAIGIFQQSDAELIVDAVGMAVAPGFIDTHAHSDFTILADPRAEGKISQGVTTEINGNCGMSAAPLYNKALERRQDDLNDLGIHERWNTLEEYFTLVMKQGVALNMATLAGHGNIRGSVIGYEGRAPSDDDISKMSVLLEAAIEEGAIGLSSGLIYPPGVYSKTEELVELAKVAGKKRLVYASHMRSESDMLLESVQEVIRIGREADAKVHISHIKTSGEKNWQKVGDVIALLEAARHSGIELTCDRYPYTASSTDLDSMLPAWTYEGGNEEEIRRLKSPDDRERIRQEIRSQTAKKDFWKTVIISAVDSRENAWMEGKSIADISNALKLDGVDTLFRILIDEKLRVGAIFLSMSEDNLKKFLALPYCMVGSDSSARSFDGTTRKGRPHPRGFGTFPRLIGRYVNESGIMNLSEAVCKMTSLPARTFRLKNRGSIKEGMYADLVIFDPNEITDRATFENPFQRSSGIFHVFVNGVPVIRDERFSGNFPGRILISSDQSAALI